MLYFSIRVEAIIFRKYVTFGKRDFNMSKLVFDRGNFADFTSVSNVFIDEYMPKANGEFVKVYLLLLRLVSTGCDDLSTTMIADKFNMLESDVIRALKFWSEQNLLSLSLDRSGNISGIRLESSHSSKYIVRDISNKVEVSTQFSNDVVPATLATASGEVIPAAVPTSSGIIVPSKKKYTAKEISSFSDNESFSQLTFLAQTYLGKTLNTSDIHSILYMLDGLKLNPDFIEYIMETCISSGHKSLSYIEKQAVAYFKKDIHNAKEAKLDSKLRQDICKSIYKVFGLPSKTPIKKEISYITKWKEDFGFSDDIILEACNRTMEHTHSASFPYADKILFDWSEKKVGSMEDINKLDKLHSEDNQKKYSTQVSAKKVGRPKNAKSFESSNYNHSKLEEQIRNSRDKKIHAILSENK